MRSSRISLETCVSRVSFFFCEIILEMETVSDALVTAGNFNAIINEERGNERFSGSFGEFSPK